MDKDMKLEKLFKKNADGSYEVTAQVSIGQPGGAVLTLRPGMKFRPGELVGSIPLERLLEVRVQVPEGADDTGKPSVGPATSPDSSNANSGNATDSPNEPHL